VRARADNIHYLYIKVSHYLHFDSHRITMGVAVVDTEPGG